MDRRFPPNRLPVAMDDALSAVAGSALLGRRTGVDAGEPDAFVCPFCGQSYTDSRRRCRQCDGVPVVPRADRDVYDTVVGLCGSGCDATALHAARPAPRPAALPR